MNNFKEFINYSNTYNKNQNTYMNNLKSNNNLYDAYNGFIRGNMFKNLYDPYKLNEPYDIKPMNEQAELLTLLNSLGFAMIDLNLYLDIYSSDTNMIDLYNQFRKEKEQILKEYENKYGPITLNSDTLNTTPWAWNDMPWPWDK